MYVDLIGSYQQSRGREPSKRVRLQTARQQQLDAERLERQEQQRECKRRADREYQGEYRIRKRAEKLAAQAAQQEREQRLELVGNGKRVRAALAVMTDEQRVSYELEGALPLTLVTAATQEDLDPTPVPVGCPSCWRTGGLTCFTCPDPTAPTRCRLEYKQGLVLRST